MSDNGMSLREVSIIYDQIYAEMQALLDKYKPCRGANGELCLRGTFCCCGCKYLHATGCTVKALWCKLWLCGDAKASAPKELMIEIERLQCVMIELPYCRWGYGRYSKIDYMYTIVRMRRRNKAKARELEINGTQTHYSR